ncbi:MAG: hypothetical protein ACLPTF_20390 [Steroidobacteraceae bacterium]
MISGERPVEIQRFVATPRMTGIDIAWSIAMVALMMLLGLGAMIVAAAFIAPAVLPPAVGSVRHGTDAVIELLILLGGLVIGQFIALLLIGFVTPKVLGRKCPPTMGAAVREWEGEFLSAVFRRVGYYFLFPWPRVCMAC